MRLRNLIAIALVIPSVSSAQARAPRGGGSRPGQPVPLGPQPEVVARTIAFQRSKYSVETYPLVSRVIAPGYSSGRPVSGWTSFGTGTRLDYRATEYVSWTLDMTASYLGGPATTETAELGTRIRPEHWDHRVRPFADLRIGFEHASDTYASAPIPGVGPGYGLSSGLRYSRGFGAAAGVGAEYALTRTFALTTSLSAMRTNMTAYHYDFISVPTADPSFAMTTYRLALGLKYNPIIPKR